MNTDERIKQIEDQLQTYKKHLCLHSIQLPNNAEYYLNISFEEQKQMTSDDLSQGACLLHRCVNYIQLELNKHQVKYNWCEKCFNYILGLQYYNLGNKYTPFEIKKQLLIKNNDVAQKLNELMAELKLYIDSIYDMPRNIKSLANSLEKYAYIKKGQKI